MMRATSDVGRPAVGRGTGKRDEPAVMPPAELADSWFRWPRPASTPPVRPNVAPPESLDDDIADAWFR